jgi:hypothetical protein
MIEKVPFWMKFKIEYFDCREFEGRNIFDSLLRSFKYALTNNITWDTKTQ